MSIQEICEVGGGDLNWMSARHVMNSFSLGGGSGSSIQGGTVNTLTNTTTTARPLPDPGHSVQQLQALLPSRPDIGFLRTDTDFLLRFLKVRNFQVASAFQLLCGYYSYRQRERDLFKTTLGGAGVRAALCDGVVGVLPERDTCGSAVLVILAANSDDCKCSLSDVWGAVILTLEKLSARGEEAGVVCVVDWSECPTRLNAQLTPKSLRLVLDGLQDAFPLRMSGLHLLNAPWWSGAALRLARPFIKEKTRARIHVHGNNLSSLHKHLPPRLLPAQLGGEGGEYIPSTWANTVLDGALTTTAAKYSIKTSSNSSPINSNAYPSKFSDINIANSNNKYSTSDCSYPDKTTDGFDDNSNKYINNPIETCTDTSNFLNSTVVKGGVSNSIGKPEEICNLNENKNKIEDFDDFVPKSKGFTFESLVKSAGSKKFQLAQMTEDSKGFTLKKIKSSSVEYSTGNSPTKSKDSISNSIFNFTKSKSLSLNTDDRITNYDDDDDLDDDNKEYGGGEESENIYNFPKLKTPPSFTSSIASSFTSNMSKMGFNMRSKDGLSSYDRGQPNSLLLSNDSNANAATVSPT
uniref:Clavesin-2-like n=2 Tax=Hirondellea gigas TaxID=1518452 RepID=A0A6A7FQP6_9CRUS